MMLSALLRTLTRTPLDAVDSGILSDACVESTSDVKKTIALPLGFAAADEDNMIIRFGSVGPNKNFVENPHWPNWPTCLE